jgi:hypothetical protein
MANRPPATRKNYGHDVQNHADNMVRHSVVAHVPETNTTKTSKKPSQPPLEPAASPISTLHGQTQTSLNTTDNIQGRAAAHDLHHTHDPNAGYIAWRGGLNPALASLIAQDHERLQNPPRELGKLGIYKQWGSSLGVAHLDPDGSRVRKGCTRLLKAFDKAHALLNSQGWKDVGDKEVRLRQVCPEYFILVPALRPKEWPWHYLEGNYGGDASMRAVPEQPSGMTHMRAHQELAHPTVTAQPARPSSQEPHQNERKRKRRPSSSPNRTEDLDLRGELEARDVEDSPWTEDRTSGSSPALPFVQSVGEQTKVKSYQSVAMTKARLDVQHSTRSNVRTAADKLPRTAKTSVRRPLAAGIDDSDLAIAHAGISTQCPLATKSTEQESLAVLQAKAEVLKITAFLDDPAYWKARHVEDRAYEMRVLAVREKEAEAEMLKAQAMFASIERAG